MSAKAPGSKAASIVTGVIYALFLVFLLAASYRQGFSHYYAHRAFRSASDRHIAEAKGHEPENPTAHSTEGEVRLRKKDYSAAAQAFEEAVKLNERGYLLWLQLGYARQQLGQFDSARAAIQRAIELAPNYSRPHFYMGMLLLDADRDDEAFEYLSRAADLDPELAPQVQRLARKNFDDPQAIEAALRPVTPEARRSVARYLIKHHQMTDSMRSFLLSKQLNAAQKNEFVKYLIHKKKYAFAREVWLSRQGQDPAAGEALIYDGGFEKITGTDPSGLGWQIDQATSSTAVARDREAVHSGEHSLNIRFAGGVELRRPIVSQLALVEPGRRYRLTFFVQAGELISAGLPAVVVTDGESSEPLAASPPIQDSGKSWVQHTVDFTAPETRIVRISLQRPSCSASPCPIFGDLSLDDLSLAEATN